MRLVLLTTIAYIHFACRAGPPRGLKRASSQINVQHVKYYVLKQHDMSGHASVQPSTQGLSRALADSSLFHQIPLPYWRKICRSADKRVLDGFCGRTLTRHVAIARGDRDSADVPVDLVNGGIETLVQPDTSPAPPAYLRSQPRLSRALPCPLKHTDSTIHAVR